MIGTAALMCPAFLSAEEFHTRLRTGLSQCCVFSDTRGILGNCIRSRHIEELISPRAWLWKGGGTLQTLIAPLHVTSPCSVETLRTETVQTGSSSLVGTVIEGVDAFARHACLVDCELPSAANSFLGRGKAVSLL